METIIESLNKLQDVLQKGMQSVRVSLKKELLQHPSQISYKNIATSALSNERYTQREKSIDAEIKKNIREQPAKTDTELAAYKENLKKITYNKNYQFSVIDTSKVPVSTSNLEGSVTIRNLGRKEITEEDDLKIWIKMSFIPKISESSIFDSDEISSSPFMEWFFMVDNCNLQYYDQLDVPLDFNDVRSGDKLIGLKDLRVGEYYIKYSLIKAECTGGTGISDDYKRVVGASFNSTKEIIEYYNASDKYTEFAVRG